MIERTKTTLMIGCLLALSLAACQSDPTPSDPSSSTEDDSHEIINLTEAESSDLGIRIQLAEAGILKQTRSFPGEIRVNQDRFTHIVPRVQGIVESVSYSEGDSVVAGQVLAVLDSRELADIKSMYLAEIERFDLAQRTFEREEGLFQQGISSENEFLEARRHLAESRISLRSATQKLLSLGFSETYISELPDQPDHALVHYQLVAPISGMVLERHIAQGESVGADKDAFAIADLSEVWVDLDIFQEQLDRVREGQQVLISSAGGQLKTSGVIRFVRPTLGEQTRTATARLILDNSSGRWRPGMFVNGTITVDESPVGVLIESSAIIERDGADWVFVVDDGAYEPRRISRGRDNGSSVEILEGLRAGEAYVSRGAFALKAELGKSELSSDHAH
jgi:cobalt-zinc-cadmium efflux system membrane fusion protein